MPVVWVYVWDVWLVVVDHEAAALKLATKNKVLLKNATSTADDLVATIKGCPSWDWANNSENLGPLVTKRDAIRSARVGFAADFTLMEQKETKLLYKHCWVQELQNYSDTMQPKIADLNDYTEMLLGMHARRRKK